MGTSQLEVDRLEEWILKAIRLVDDRADWFSTARLRILSRSTESRDSCLSIHLTTGGKDFLIWAKLGVLTEKPRPIKRELLEIGESIANGIQRFWKEEWLSYYGDGNVRIVACFN